MMPARDNHAVEERLRKILCDLLLLRPEEVQPESLLVDELDVDSITLLELAFTIDQEFGVRFPDVKANEEMFALALPDALKQLEAASGGMTFFEYVKSEAMHKLLNGGTPGDVDPESIFSRQSAASLASAVRGRVPSGVEPGRSLADLRLHELFRFLTVATLADYVGHLLETPRPTA